MSKTNTKFKKEIESYGSATFSEMVSQCGGMSNISDIVPHDVIESSNITIETLFQFIRDFDSLCIIGVNTK